MILDLAQFCILEKASSSSLALSFAPDSLLSSCDRCLISRASGSPTGSRAQNPLRKQRQSLRETLQPFFCHVAVDPSTMNHLQHSDIRSNRLPQIPSLYRFLLPTSKQLGTSMENEVVDSLCVTRIRRTLISGQQERWHHNLRQCSAV